MRTWPVQDVKARVSEAPDACLPDGLPLVARPSLKSLLLADGARAEPVSKTPRTVQRRPPVQL
jgi:hypothetical protein